MMMLMQNQLIVQRKQKQKLSMLCWQLVQAMTPSRSGLHVKTACCTCIGSCKAYVLRLLTVVKCASMCVAACPYPDHRCLNA